MNIREVLFLTAAILTGLLDDAAADEESLRLESEFPVTHLVLNVTGNSNLIDLLASTRTPHSPNAGLYYFAASELLLTSLANWTGNGEVSFPDPLSMHKAELGNVSHNLADLLLANSLVLAHVTEGTPLQGFADISIAATNLLNPTLAQSISLTYSVSPVTTFSDEPSGGGYAELISETAEAHLTASGALRALSDIDLAHDALFDGGSVPRNELAPAFKGVAVGDVNLLLPFLESGAWRKSADIASLIESRGGDIQLISNSASGSEGAAQGTCTESQISACRTASSIAVQTPFLTAGAVYKSLEAATSSAWDTITNVSDPNEKIDHYRELVEQSYEAHEAATNACLENVVDCEPAQDQDDHEDNQDDHKDEVPTSDEAKSPFCESSSESCSTNDTHDRSGLRELRSESPESAGAFTPRPGCDPGDTSCEDPCIGNPKMSGCVGPEDPIMNPPPVKLEPSLPSLD